jgi:hypothetical protein
MKIQAIVAGVDLATGEPAVEGLVGIVQDFVPFFVPMAVLSRFPPEPLWVFKGPSVTVFV